MTTAPQQASHPNTREWQVPLTFQSTAESLTRLPVRQEILVPKISEESNNMAHEMFEGRMKSYID